MNCRSLRLSIRHSLLPIAAAFAAMLAAPQAGAIITDTGAVPPIPLGLDLGGVGMLSNGCSATLLGGGSYVLASAHCAAAAGGSVSFLGGTVTASIASTVFAPNWVGQTAIGDLSISRLVTPVTAVSGYAIAMLSSRVTPIVLAGYGQSGSGSSGASGPGGTLRFGYNNYETRLADDPDADPPAFYNGGVYGFDFDDGSAALNRFGTLGTPGEAMLAPGDSGGPSFAYFERSGGWKLVGVHSAIDDSYGFGFGGIGYDVLTGPYAAWINQVVAGSSIAAVPEPASAALLLAGLAAIGAAAGRRQR